MTTIKLSKPIQAHGEERGELSFREPTGRDLRRAGVPYMLTSEGDVAIAAEAMHRMIAALAEIPEGSVDQLSGADWNVAAMEVLPLCLPAAAAGSSSATTSPSSGDATAGKSKPS